MRNNQPVTSTEYTLGDDVTLMSKTDPKGRITYANQPFVDVSGFSQAELTDQPHNLVRHPDMPAQAFADMWATLKSGRSWSALVKNRRKNGDFYWVRANATPIRHGGVTKGYMSVRSKPLATEVAGAEQLYKQFRDGTAGARAFRQGIVVRTGVLAWIDLFKVLPVGWRVRGAFAIAALLPIAAAAAAGVGGVPLAIVAATAVLAALLSDVVVEQQVTRPLTTILEHAQCVASGASHPAVNLDRIDEIGLLTRSITQISLSQQALVHDVNARASSVRDGSAEIAQGNQDLSQRTEQQAAALEETAASMEQLSATVRQNADNASHANTLTQNSSSIAARGGEMMNKVTETMRDINASSKRIADIVGVIDSIAFQTNILALNAAVEAARAGEQGRGFAVVASEVRSLAGRSAEAAREIKTLIAASVARVAEGNTLVDKAGATMTEVVDSVKRVTEIMAEITAASAEQSAGVSQVGEAVSQMDQVTQQNAALVEQSAAAAESLREQSLALVQVVSAFLAEGDRANAPHARPAAKAARASESRAPAVSRTAAPRPAAAPAARHTDTADEWLAA